MDTIRFALLGPPHLLVDGRPADVETRKALAVLARVVVEGPQRRDTLDAMLWPGSDARRARQALRRTLSALRKALPEGSLDEGDDVALSVPVSTDLADVEGLVGAAVTTDTAALAAAADLHRGTFLEGLHFRESDPFEHWRRDTAQQCDRRHVQVLERWCRALIAEHDFAAATEVAQRRLALDPLHEPSHQQLMLLHAWQGDRSSAARQYAACTRVLDEELGVAPLPRTAALDRAVRAGTLEPPPRVTATADGAATAVTARTTPSPPPSTPLVGRGEQLAALVEQWNECRRGGGAALVVGEAGIGKTRLVEELLAATTGPVLRVTARPEESGLAYAPVMAALRGAGTALHELDDATRAEVARLVPDAAGVTPPSAPLASPADRARFVDACATALLALLSGDHDPGVLVIEDVDRADDETRELIVHLGARLADHPVLVIVTCREVPPGLDGGQRLDLLRLTRAEVEQLAADRDAGAIADRLYEESEGVPFLVVSYLDVRGDGDGDDWSLPAAGRDLVRQRLDQLDEVSRQVLAAVAVLGGPQSTDILERVSGRSPDEVVGAIERLTAAGIVALDAEGRCEPTHDKLRTVVLDEISPVRRRLLHGRAADALLALPSAVAAATLARHLAGAGREPEAATAHAAAGRRAADLYANAEAIEHCERALAMGHEDPARLLLLLGDLRVRAGDYAGAERRYVRASAHAAEVAVVEQRLGALALRRGDDELAEARLRLALEAGPTGELLVRTLAPLAQVLARRGDLSTAAELAMRATKAADGLQPSAAAVAHNVAGLVARRRGDLGTARQHLRASLAAAEHPEHRAAALNNLAQVLGEDGATDEALVLANEALQAGRATGDRHREAALLSNLADLLHAAGRTTEAITLQAEAAERFAGVGESATTSPEIWRLVDW